MSEAITPSVGRGVLHLFCKPTPLLDGEAVVAAVKAAEAEGKGLAFEAAQATRAHAYADLGWQTAISLIDPANLRSQAERFGAEIITDTAGSSKYSTPVASTPTPLAPTQATLGKRSRNRRNTISACGASWSCWTSR